MCAQCVPAGLARMETKARQKEAQVVFQGARDPLEVGAEQVLELSQVLQSYCGIKFSL